MEERAKFLIAYAAEHGPVSVRGLYYQAEVRKVPGIAASRSGPNSASSPIADVASFCRCPVANCGSWARGHLHCTR
jgi:hypothetical protein